MIKARIRWCSCRVENILTLRKLLGLWFCFLLHSILFFISQTSYLTYKIISSYALARPIMGTIFLVILYIRFSIEQTRECLARQLHGSAWNMTRYFTSSDSIITSRRRVEIQRTSEMSPYFTMTKCNKLFITYLTRSTERLPSLPSSISTNSTISMTVVMTTLFKKR